MRVVYPTLNITFIVLGATQHYQFISDTTRGMSGVKGFFEREPIAAAVETGWSSNNSFLPFAKE